MTFCDDAKASRVHHIACITFGTGGLLVAELSVAIDPFYNIIDPSSAAGRRSNAG